MKSAAMVFCNPGEDERRRRRRNRWWIRRRRGGGGGGGVMERRRQEGTQEEERVEVAVCSLCPPNKHRCEQILFLRIQYQPSIPTILSDQSLQRTQNF